MTREEALKIWLPVIKTGVESMWECNEALDMAIKALEQEPHVDWYDVPSDEMTLGQARQAVKDLRKMWAEHLEKEPYVVKIKDLSDDEIKKFEKEMKKVTVQVISKEPCENCISRQAALDIFGLSEKSRKYGGDHSGYDTIMLYEVQDALEALPPVTPQPKYEDIAKAFQFGLAFGFGEKYNEMDKVIDELKNVITPQPKMGHWEFVHPLQEDDGGAYMCSECKVGYLENCGDWIYCPNCGAKMQEV